ncbi:cell envelope integrity TolA C-terminal domain-containing protein [Kosakonia sp. WA-90]|uniref:cell envelope integrity TolA C-terminal domain-containing protein n=1 Tax=Kosakonia sp. WA-90 TaxID=3153576 RepID=UPI00325E899B
MFKKEGMALLVFMITGCTTTHKISVPKGIDEYAASAKSAVESAFSEPDKFKGKTCSLYVHQPSGGKVTGVEVEKGDVALCKASLVAINTAVKSGHFPDKPEGLPERIVFDFKP